VWPKKVAKVVGRINDVFTMKTKFLSVGQSNDRWDNASFVIAFGYLVKNVINLFGHHSTLQHFIDFLSPEKVNATTWHTRHHSRMLSGGVHIYFSFWDIFEIDDSISRSYFH
jgi:hypothetical protein